LKKENIYKPIQNNYDCNENISLKGNINDSVKSEDKIILNNYYFLFGIFNFIQKTKKRFFLCLISLIIIFFIDIKLFINRIKLWVFFNDKSKTLPKMASLNTTFYITATLLNIDYIIKDYIKEMIKLINYLGKENVIVSIVENNDSTDNTTEHLILFQDYLNKHNIINRFIFEHEVIDDREQQLLFFEHDEGYLRIKFYSQLRNKCLELLPY
jgi:hypothetical protein